MYLSVKVYLAICLYVCLCMCGGGRGVEMGGVRCYVLNNIISVISVRWKVVCNGIPFMLKMFSRQAGIEPGTAS